MQPNVLTTNLTKVVSDLKTGGIKYAFVEAGYWNATTSEIVYEHNDTTFTTIINALHAINVAVLAWVMSNGAMDISPANRQNLYDQIIACMSKGFDGYNDDIEDYNGTLQNWIDYENNCTIVLHSLPDSWTGTNKIMTADVPLDWQQNINMYLHMDYIVSMFYGIKSTLEDPQAAAFWQEDFGEYNDLDNPPASPMIMGIMNYYGNEYPLTWQLGQVDKYLADYGHPQLAGFSLWLYEYMGTNPDDWSQWDYWITRVGTNTPQLWTATITSSPITGVEVAFNGTRYYTPNVQYAFNGTTLVLTSPPSVTYNNTLYNFSNWSDGANETKTTLTLTSNTTITVNYYAAATPEFQPYMLLPLLIITTLLVTIVHKKKQEAENTGPGQTEMKHIHTLIFAREV